MTSRTLAEGNCRRGIRRSIPKRPSGIAVWRNVRQDSRVRDI
jgi:hypothetical protein